MCLEEAIAQVEDGVGGRAEGGGCPLAAGTGAADAHFGVPLADVDAGAAFVIAGRDSMRVVRWSHITVTAERWESGTGDDRGSGTRRTLRAPDGTVLAHFTGREP